MQLTCDRLYLHEAIESGINEAIWFGLNTLLLGPAHMFRPRQLHGQDNEDKRITVIVVIKLSGP